MQTKSFLIEIGTEELPPEHLDVLGENWLKLICQNFEKNFVSFGKGQYFIAPRRIALLIEEVPSELKSRHVQKRGPSLKAAYNDKGEPSGAALGFARSNNTTVEKLEKLETDKGSWLIFNLEEPGKLIDEIIPGVVQTALHQLPIKKRMHWGSSDDEFIRPVHWVVALHGNKVIPFELFGCQSGQTSYGHRFHHPQAIQIDEASRYPELMREAYVIADYHERQKVILDKSQALAISVSATAKIDDDLLDLVTGLNEWPTPMLASFDEAFLQVPQEALITAMQHHQKCFPLLDADGKLINKFILIANTDAKPNDLIIHGNERVMHARLNDAQFFYNQDCKVPLETHLESLKNMIFQKKLGSLYDKTQRVKKLATSIATRIKAPIHHAERAGLLCKCDLLTQMVGEFPELQGIMGQYYAKNDGEANEVALAIEQAYLPRFSKDNLPANPTGVCVSLADKLDTIVGIFGVGKGPTGDSDPFGLRRAAFGVIRIIVEQSLPLDLKELITESVALYRSKVSEDVILEALNFCFERFKAWYQDKGVSPKVLDAVWATQLPTQPLDFAKRIEAVNHFQTLPQAEALAAANKRVRNILTKSGFKIKFHDNPSINASQLKESAEVDLFEHMQKLKETTNPLVANGQYTETLSELAQLREVVDQFFDEVMVNVEDDALRQNRVNLLSTLHNLFGQVADISRL